MHREEQAAEQPHEADARRRWLAWRPARIRAPNGARGVLSAAPSLCECSAGLHAERVKLPAGYERHNLA